MTLSKIVLIFCVLLASHFRVSAHQENPVTIYSYSPDGKYTLFLRESGGTRVVIYPNDEHHWEYPNADLYIAKRIDYQTFADERLLQTGIALPLSTAGGFTLEIQAEWSIDNHWLVYRWRDINQRERLAVFDRVREQQTDIFIPLYSASVQIPQPGVILDSLSKDGQFIALQQSGRIIFYATATLKQIFPRGAAPAAFTNAATCIVPYNAVRNYCVHWSPTGHRAVYGVDIGKEIYLRLLDPTGVEKERLFRLRDNLNKRPFTRFVKWSPESELVAVMTNIFADGDSFSRKISIDIYGIDGASYTSISENIAYEAGEGIIVLAEWCKPDVMLFVEAASRTFTTYNVSRKRLEKSTIKFEDDTSVLRKYFSKIPACQ